MHIFHGNGYAVGKEGGAYAALDYPASVSYTHLDVYKRQSHGDAMVTVLEGTGKFTVDGKEYILEAGETLVMPAGKPHAVYGQEAFKMLLTVIFPLEG